MGAKSTSRPQKFRGYSTQVVPSSNIAHSSLSRYNPSLGPRTLCVVPLQDALPSAGMVVWETLDALSHQLELCNVSAETQLAVLIDPTLDAEQIAQTRAAVARSGASAIEIHLSPNECVNNEPFNAAINVCDLIITTGGHDRCAFAIDDRVLHLHSITRQSFAPHASLRRRVRSLVGAIASATTLTVSGANGTDISVTLSGSSTEFDHGFVTTGHNRASFPAGWVNVTPTIATVHGQLVLMPGDANLNADRLINSPVVLQIVDDHISAIEGDSPDADVMRALLEHPGETSAFGIAGVSIGLNPGAVVSGPFDDRLLDPVIGRLLAGVVQLSFGDNLVADRPCPQTVTVALRDRSVHLEALPVVVAGRLDGDFAPDVYEV